MSLNSPYLESKGIEVISTYLGERILQLAKVLPNHIEFPVIHKTKEDFNSI